jgi:putative transposase
VCDLFGVHRSSYKYWLDHSKAPSRERVKLLDEVRAAHKDSNGSAGGQMVTTIVSDRVTPLSRYCATELMKELKLVSCQMSRHCFKKVNQEYMAVSNKLAREFSVIKLKKYTGWRCHLYLDWKKLGLLSISSRFICP